MSALHLSRLSPVFLIMLGIGGLIRLWWCLLREWGKHISGLQSEATNAGDDKAHKRPLKPQRLPELPAGNPCCSTHTQKTHSHTPYPPRVRRQESHKSQRHIFKIGRLSLGVSAQLINCYTRESGQAVKINAPQHSKQQSMMLVGKGRSKNMQQSLKRKGEGRREGRRTSMLS